MADGPVCVSVVIPTYNHANCIVETLNSVFAQTFIDYEVIVVNDGSPDATATVLAPFVAAGKIRYIEQPNAGQGAARNRGLAEARGEFIAFLDDDDLWPPDKLQWQVDALRANPTAVLAYGYMQTFGHPPIYSHPHADVPSGQVKRALLGQAVIRSPGQTLIRGDVLRRIGGFDPNIWGCDDWDLLLRLADAGPFVYVHRLALNYRNHAANASRNVRRMHANARKVLHKHVGRFPTPGNWADWYPASRFVRQFNYRDAMRFANDALKRGDRKEAFRNWRAAIAINPLGIRGAIGLLRNALSGRSA